MCVYVHIIFRKKGAMIESINRYLKKNNDNIGLK